MENPDSSLSAFDENTLAHYFSEISPALLVVLSTERKILYANAKMLTFMGKKSIDEVRGMSFGDATRCDVSVLEPRKCGLSPHCQTCSLFRSLHEIKLNNTLISEMTLKNKNGQTVEFRARMRPIKIGEDYVTAIMMHDISDEKRREMLERLFFHDFLNAASGILGLLDIMEMEETNSQEAEQMLHTARVCAEYLVDEINFSRALASAENDTLELKPEPIHVNEAMNKASAFFSMTIEHSGVRLKIERPKRDFSIITDKTLINRILINLVKNAIEASQRDQTVTLKAVDDSTGSVIFEVHNEMVMPFEVKEQVFVRSFSTKGKGRGIGTYSVKLFTEQFLKGKVWLTSEAGKGTSFFVQIPTLMM